MERTVEQVNLSEINRRGVGVDMVRHLDMPADCASKIITFFDYLTRNVEKEKNGGSMPISGKYGLTPAFLPILFPSALDENSYIGDTPRICTKEVFNELIKFLLVEGYITLENENYVTTDKTTQLVKRIIKTQANK